jgi:hypothetical protein
MREAERARRLDALEEDPPRAMITNREGATATPAVNAVLRLERARIDAMGFHPWIPVVEDLAVDPQGTLWVQRTSGTPGKPGPTDVLDPDGGYVGTLNAAGPRIPWAFGPGGVMATVDTDGFGAPIVRVERLVTGG